MQHISMFDLANGFSEKGKDTYQVPAILDNCVYTEYHLLHDVSLAVRCYYFNFIYPRFGNNIGTFLMSHPNITAGRLLCPKWKIVYTKKAFSALGYAKAARESFGFFGLWRQFKCNFRGMSGRRRSVRRLFRFGCLEFDFLRPRLLFLGGFGILLLALPRNFRLRRRDRFRRNLDSFYRFGDKLFSFFYSSLGRTVCQQLINVDFDAFKRISRCSEI